MNDLEFFKTYADQIRKAINKFLSSYTEIEINKELLEEDSDLEDLFLEGLNNIEIALREIEGRNEFPQKVINLIKAYLRKTEILKNHIRKIATSNESDLEPLLTDLVLLYTRDFIEEKGDYPISSDWCFESINPQKVDFLWNIYQQVEDINLKASLVRGMSLLAPNNRYVESLLISTLSRNELRKNLKWLLYYEYLQNKVEKFIKNPVEEEIFPKLLEEAKKEFPNDDMFYEIEGHIGVHFFLEGNEKEAKNYLQKFYDWIIYRHLADIKPVNLSLNSIIFLVRYAELLIDEGIIEEAKKVLETTENLIKKYRTRFYEESPEIFQIYLEELKEVEQKLEEI